MINKKLLFSILTSILVILAVFDHDRLLDLVLWRVPMGINIYTVGVVITGLIYQLISLFNRSKKSIL